LVTSKYPNSNEIVNIVGLEVLEGSILISLKPYIHKLESFIRKKLGPQINFNQLPFDKLGLCYMLRVISLDGMADHKTELWCSRWQPEN